MGGYVKLFGSILQSSLWVGSDPAVKVVWITMLALADQHGIVHASVPGLAHEACVPTEDARRALALFMSPDKDSRTREHDGRRIEECEEGWQLLNYKKYRELQTERQAKDAARQSEWRARRRRDMSQESRGVVATASASAEAKEEPEGEKRGGEDTSCAEAAPSSSPGVLYQPDLHVDKNGHPLTERQQLIKDGEDCFRRRGVLPPDARIIARWMSMVEEVELDSIVSDLQASGKLFALTPDELPAYVFGCIKQYLNPPKSPKGKRS